MRRVLPILALLSVAAACAQSDEGGAAVYAHAAGAVASGDWATAEGLLTGALARDRRDAEAHHLLALLYADDGPLHDARRARRHADEAVAADPDNPRYLETRLRQYQRDLPEERAFSMTDGRRAALARQILALDPASAVAHEERALATFLEFDWRRSLAEQRGGWDRAADRGMSGAANRALGRTLEHLDAALATEPGRASAHRLRLRAHATARDHAGLLDAAERFRGACPDDPDAALFLGLALFRNDLLAAAETQLDAALAAMPEHQRRRFEDVTLFLADDDAIGPDTAAFAEAFWQRRDPRLLSAQNERRIEHLARLALADLLFTEAHRDRRGWESVRGEVAVRYGLPLREASQLSLRDGRFTRWVYDDFSLLFHDAFASGDADFWSSASGEDAFTRAHSLMRRVPERFDYAPAHRVALPFAAATFRGAGGRTDVAVHLGVPGEPPQAITAGAFLLGPDGTVVAESRRSVTRRTALPETVTLSARPGRYTLAAEFELGGAAVGFERAPLDVPDYTGRELALSDFVVAHHVEEAEAGETGGFVRRGHRIAPAVEPVFATSQPIYLYVEAYNLRVEGGRSRYAVEVSLEPEAPGGLAGLARRLLGADERGVAVEFEGEAPGADLGEYVILDASRRTPGPYLLTLRLRDRVSGEAIARTAKLFLE